AYNSRVSTLASSLGYRICTWTIDTRDWQKPDGVHRRSTTSIRYIVRTAPRSAKASGVVLGHLFTNYPNAISGIIDHLHRQGLLFCRNRGPVGAYVPFPLSCTCPIPGAGLTRRRVRASPRRARRHGGQAERPSSGASGASSVRRSPEGRPRLRHPG